MYHTNNISQKRNVKPCLPVIWIPAYAGMTTNELIKDSLEFKPLKLVLQFFLNLLLL